jgi:hypothetical protein
MCYLCPEQEKENWAQPVPTALPSAPGFAREQAEKGRLKIFARKI